jgi:hypothetical protein
MLRKNFHFPVSVILTGLLFMLLISCTDDDKKETNDDNGNQAVKTVTNALTSGTLDTLYVERAAFDSINGNSRIVFSFVFKTADSLTLHGWLQKGSNFDSLPGIIMKNKSASPYTYGVGTYFGNVVISPPNFAHIKNALNNTTWTHVLFAPYKLGNNIKYKVLVSNDAMNTQIGILVTSETGGDANPSPPKNY